MNSVRSNNLNLKCQLFTPQGCKDIGKFKFVVEIRLIPLFRNVQFVKCILHVHNIS